MKRKEILEGYGGKDWELYWYSNPKKAFGNTMFKSKKSVVNKDGSKIPHPVKIRITIEEI